MENYEVFARNWWKIENGKKVPAPDAEKDHIGYFETEKEAREMCKEFNEENDEGILSYKAEYRGL